MKYNVSIRGKCAKSLLHCRHKDKNCSKRMYSSLPRIANTVQRLEAGILYVVCCFIDLDVF